MTVAIPALLVCLAAVVALVGGAQWWSDEREARRDDGR